MAFRKPANLECLTFHHQGAIDALTDVILGSVRTPIEIFYIDVLPEDANDTYDTFNLTLEYQAIGGGADTVIDVIAVPANTGTQVITSVDADALTEGSVPADSEIIMTINDITTGPDTGVKIQIWYLPEDAPNV